MVLLEMYQRFIDNLWFKKDPGMVVVDKDFKDRRNALLCIRYEGENSQVKYPIRIAKDLVRYAIKMEEFNEGDLDIKNKLSVANVIHLQSDFEVRIESKGDNIFCLYSDWTRFKRLVNNYMADLRDHYGE